MKRGNIAVIDRRRPQQVGAFLERRAGATSGNQLQMAGLEVQRKLGDEEGAVSGRG